jgi:hypothetical protein
VDPGCSFRILIFIYPGSQQRQQKSSHKYHKLVIICFKNWYRKKIWANLQRIIGFRSGIRNPGSDIRYLGSGKNLIRIHASKNAPDPRYRIWIRNTLWKILWRKYYKKSSIADPNPDQHVSGPPGSGSTSQRYGSGSFYKCAKIVRKTLISTILWLFFTFYLWKMM